MWPRAGARACSPRCVRMRSINAESRMAGMILNWPPQFGQCSRVSNARLSSRAQLMRAGRPCAQPASERPRPHRRTTGRPLRGAESRRSETCFGSIAAIRCEADFLRQVHRTQLLRVTRQPVVRIDSKVFCVNSFGLDSGAYVGAQGTTPTPCGRKKTWREGQVLRCASSTIKPVPRPRPRSTWKSMPSAAAAWRARTRVNRTRRAPAPGSGIR